MLVTDVPVSLLSGTWRGGSSSSPWGYVWLHSFFQPNLRESDLSISNWSIRSWSMVHHFRSPCRWLASSQVCGGFFSLHPEWGGHAPLPTLEILFSYWDLVFFCLFAFGYYKDAIFTKCLLTRLWAGHWEKDGTRYNFLSLYCLQYKEKDAHRCKG